MDDFWLAARLLPYIVAGGVAWALWLAFIVSEFNNKESKWITYRRSLSSKLVVVTTVMYTFFVVVDWMLEDEFVAGYLFLPTALLVWVIIFFYKRHEKRTTN